MRRGLLSSHNIVMLVVCFFKEAGLIQFTFLILINSCYLLWYMYHMGITSDEANAYFYNFTFCSFCTFSLLRRKRTVIHLMCRSLKLLRIPTPRISCSGRERRPIAATWTNKYLARWFRRSVGCSILGACAERSPSTETGLRRCWTPGKTHSHKYVLIYQLILNSGDIFYSICLPDTVSGEVKYFACFETMKNVEISLGPGRSWQNDLRVWPWPYELSNWQTRRGMT